jgi:hypothetical protein
VLGKTTNQCEEFLYAFIEPPLSKQIVIAKLPTRPVTVQLPDYANYKQKDHTVFIRKVETMLKFDAA